MRSYIIYYHFILLNKKISIYNNLSYVDILLSLFLVLFLSCSCKGRINHATVACALCQSAYINQVKICRPPNPSPFPRLEEGKINRSDSLIFVEKFFRLAPLLKVKYSLAHTKRARIRIFSLASRWISLKNFYLESGF